MLCLSGHASPISSEQQGSFRTVILMHLASNWKRHLQIKKIHVYSSYKNKALSPKPCTCKYSMELHDKCWFICCPSRTHIKMYLIHDKDIQLKPLHENTNVETSAGMLQLQDMLQCFPSCFYPNLEWNFTDYKMCCSCSSCA